jgi:hypothetical protein
MQDVSFEPPAFFVLFRVRQLRLQDCNILTPNSRKQEIVSNFRANKVRTRKGEPSSAISQKYCESRREKVTKQREVKKKAEAKRKESRWKKFFYIAFTLVRAIENFFF